MKKISTNINHKWNLLWAKYKKAKTAKRKEKFRKELYALLVYNAVNNQHNYENRGDLKSTD